MSEYKPKLLGSLDNTGQYSQEVLPVKNPRSLIDTLAVKYKFDMQSFFGTPERWGFHGNFYQKRKKTITSSELFKMVNDVGDLWPEEYRKLLDKSKSQEETKVILQEIVKWYCKDYKWKPIEVMTYYRQHTEAFLENNLPTALIDISPHVRAAAKAYGDRTMLSFSKGDAQ